MDPRKKEGQVRAGAKLRVGFIMTAGDRPRIATELRRVIFMRSVEEL